MGLPVTVALTADAPPREGDHHPHGVPEKGRVDLLGGLVGVKG